MRQVIILCGLLMLVASLGIGGCHIGGGTDTRISGDTFEYSMRRQLDRLEEDYTQGRISRSEYDQRKKRILDGALIY